LPRQERLIYTETIGKESWTVTQDLLLKSMKGRDYYEITSHSPRSDELVRLDASTLFATYSEVVTRTPDSVIRRTSEVLEAHPDPKNDELIISDFYSLQHLLRGLPWGTFGFARLVSLAQGAGGPPFSLELTIQGKETVRINDTPYECWKVQLGIGGIMSALFGKTFYWYAVDPPHVLVRYKGSSRGPGSPQRVLELQSRSINAD
jgi:hypothetical protein